MKNNVSKFTNKNDLEKAQINGTEKLCQEKPNIHLEYQVSECQDNVIYEEIVFPRALIDEAKAVFKLNFQKEFTDEWVVQSLYKYARVEILAREIKKRNEERKRMAVNTETKEEKSNDRHSYITA